MNLFEKRPELYDAVNIDNIYGKGTDFSQRTSRQKNFSNFMRICSSEYSFKFMMHLFNKKPDLAKACTVTNLLETCPDTKLNSLLMLLVIPDGLEFLEQILNLNKKLRAEIPIPALRQEVVFDSGETLVPIRSLLYSSDTAFRVLNLLCKTTPMLGVDILNRLRTESGNIILLKRMVSSDDGLQLLTTLLDNPLRVSTSLMQNVFTIQILGSCTQDPENETDCPSLYLLTKDTGRIKILRRMLEIRPELHNEIPLHYLNMRMKDGGCILFNLARHGNEDSRFILSHFINPDLDMNTIIPFLRNMSVPESPNMKP